MRCLVLLGALCLTVLRPASASAQTAPAAPAAQPSEGARPTRARPHRDLIVPPGFGDRPAETRVSSELIVPEIFRSDGPPTPIRTPAEWQRERAEPSELRVPAIFRETTESPSFDPPRIDDALRVPEMFRARPVPAGEPVYRVRDELRAPGFPSRTEAPAPSGPPAAAGLGRRLDSPSGR